MEMGLNQEHRVAIYIKCDYQVFLKSMDLPLGKGTQLRSASSVSSVIMFTDPTDPNIVHTAIIYGKSVQTSAVAKLKSKGLQVPVF